MNHFGSRCTLILATGIFLGWTLLNTVFWPLEDYADVTSAYAESTNQIVRAMSIGIAGYMAVLGTIVGWNVTQHRSVQTTASPKPNAG